MQNSTPENRLPGKMVSPLPPAARDFLVKEIEQAQKHAREALYELGNILERVKGICHWFQRDVQCFDWCAERLAEASEALADTPFVPEGGDHE